jgi:uncharacterized membrane protein
MTFTSAMEDIQQAFEAAAAFILLAGITFGFFRAARDLAAGRTDTYRRVRSFVGRSLLLGLEVFVAADLIRTVAVDPSLNSVGVLALIVLIRTFLSFSLDIEIEGRFPWRAAPDDAKST